MLGNVLNLVGGGDGDGGGEVKLVGTDHSEQTGSEFKFVSASDSNVVVKMKNDGVVEIGVYWI